MASDSADELVIIARILKPRGLRGELKVRLLTGFPEDSAGDMDVFVGREPGRVVSMRIERIVHAASDVIVKFDGIDDRTAAEAMNGAEIFTQKTDLPLLPDGSYYPFELIGAEVFDESGNVLGTVVKIERYPAQDVLVIVSAGTAFMAPAASEFFVSFDRDAKRLVLRLPEGLPPYPGEL